MKSECVTCKDKIDQYAPSNPEVTVRYYQWQSNDKIDKVEIIGTVGDAFFELKRLLKDFLLHTYVKRKQSKYMKNLISGVNKKKVLLQVDFSENASITSQNEVQSAHWSHGSATLFTAVWARRHDFLTIMSACFTPPFLLIIHVLITYPNTPA